MHIVNSTTSELFEYTAYVSSGVYLGLTTLFTLRHRRRVVYKIVYV